MLNKFLLLIVLILAVGAQGCNTIKGAGYGMRKDVEVTKNQFTDANSELNRADDWLEEHLW